jgi:uncharacterized protein YceK
MTRVGITTTSGIAVMITLSGCGAMAGNIAGSGEHFWEVYGGVKTDVDFGTYCFKNSEEASPVGHKAFWLFAGVSTLIVDLPLSAVADTLTLPWTIKATLDGEERRTLLFGMPRKPGRWGQEEKIKPCCNTTPNEKSKTSLLFDTTDLK